MMPMDLLRPARRPSTAWAKELWLRLRWAATRAAKPTLETSPAPGLIIYAINSFTFALAPASFAFALAFAALSPLALSFALAPSSFVEARVCVLATAFA